jgi:hypothetical protein
MISRYRVSRGKDPVGVDGSRHGKRFRVLLLGIVVKVPVVIVGVLPVVNDPLLPVGHSKLKNVRVRPVHLEAVEAHVQNIVHLRVPPGHGGRVRVVKKTTVSVPPFDQVLAEGAFHKVVILHGFGKVRARESKGEEYFEIRKSVMKKKGRESSSLLTCPCRS